MINIKYTADVYRKPKFEEKKKKKKLVRSCHSILVYT